MVCEAHLPSYNTQSLPYGQHIKLSTEDIDKIKTVIRKYLRKKLLNFPIQISVKAFKVNFSDGAPKHIQHGVETLQSYDTFLLFTQPA